MNTVYKLRAASTSSADGVASLDIQEDGIIEGVYFSLNANLSADTESVRWELSFSSTSGFAANDTRASIAGVTSHMGLATSGAVNGAVNQYIPMSVDVKGGERLYAHTVVAGTIATNDTSIWIYVSHKGGRAPRPNFR